MWLPYRRIGESQGMRTSCIGSVVAIAAAISTPVYAAEATVAFRIPAGSLAPALTTFSQQAGVSLLVDPALVEGVKTAGLIARVEPRQGLERLLSGSGLSYQRLPGGDYVVVRYSSHAAAMPPRPTADDVTILPELLVVGRRSLNTDIPRSVDDIQPYQIATGSQITLAQSKSVEDFLRSRSPSNSELMAQNQAPVQNQGANGSTINLGGFGTSQTLVLVDGRRLAGISVFGDFLQPDLNAISPVAIGRIETLTSTAGGIYGPSAVGGVVNVVLKRDFDGVELGGTTGVSDHGDSRHWRLDGSAGGTLNGGATHVMLAVGRAEDDGLRVGQRDYIYRSRLTRNSNNASPNPLTSPSLNILGSLPLKIVGGPTLPSLRTSLPPSASLANGGVDTLIANAGAFDLHLSPDGAGTLQSAVASTAMTSAVLSLRHSASPRVELFGDVLLLDNKGTAAGPWLSGSYVILPVGKNGNPFTSAVGVTFPTPGRFGVSSTDIQTRRATLGAIARLPSGWSADLDLGVARTRTEATPFSGGTAADFLKQTGVNLFAGAEALEAALASYTPPAAAEIVHLNTMTDANLHLAGPLFRTGAGATTLTLLAEARREHSPLVTDPAVSFVNLYNPNVDQSESVGSGYAELRAPLIADDDSFGLLRGLELQLAGRFDSFEIKVPARKVTTGGLVGIDAIHANMSVSALTAGFKVLPVRGVLLRASYSTGYLPPSPSQLIPVSYVTAQMPGGTIPDPKRPGDTLGAAASYRTQLQGSPTLRPEKARTFSMGAILRPEWLPGLRISIDYTRTAKSGEIGLPLSESQSNILVLEDRYPGIVKRAPPSAEDLAKGYVVGPVVFLDTSLRNIGHSKTHITEINGEYARENQLGSFVIYGHAAWQPSFLKTTNPSVASYQLAGRLDGPLRLRGNAGVTWSKSAWDAGLNLQFYSHYSVAYGANDAQSVQLSRGTFGTVQYQGSDNIPSQSYLDATLGYTFRRKTAPVIVRMGVRNLLGSSPPAVSIPLQPLVYGFTTEQGIGYSPYGDPRGRRFELSVSQRF